MITKNMSAAQIIVFDPIIKETAELKELYYYTIKRYISMGKWKSKYVRSEMNLYAQRLLNDTTEKRRVSASFVMQSLDSLKEYKINLVADICAILGYEKRWVNSYNFLDVYKVMVKELGFSAEEIRQANKLIEYVISKKCRRKAAVSDIDLLDKDVFDRLTENIDFIDRKPFSFLVTATMSAGKSTFINSLTGKQINLSQNLACTSKIHSIINKPFEDGYSYEYDFDLELNADKATLYDDNEKNMTNTIWASTCFDSKALYGKRIIIHDSPGVNSSENEEHRLVTEKMLGEGKYNAVLYVINATQLGTEDETRHLKYIKEHLKKPILFILNKIDAFNDEDEDIMQTIDNCRKYLENEGFDKPLICPVSSYAGLLAKRSLSGEPLSRYESRTLDNFFIDFEQNDLSQYYEAQYEIHIEEPTNEAAQLIKRCGLGYTEELIRKFI